MLKDLKNLFGSKDEEYLNKVTSNLRQKIEAEIREERIREMDKIKLFELEEFLNNFVIVVSNEVDNLLVGYAKEIVYVTKASVPMIVVHDVVNKRDVMPGGVMLTYTEQKFNALNKLHPNERIAIYYNKRGLDEINKDHLMKEPLIDSDVWSEKVNLGIQEFTSQYLEKQNSTLKKMKA